MAEGVVRLLAADRPRPTGYAPVNTNRRAMRPQNTRGYRDRERTTAKPPGTRRVVSLGDSFHTEGFFKRESSLVRQLFGEGRPQSLESGR